MMAVERIDWPAAFYYKMEITVGTHTIHYTEYKNIGTYYTVTYNSVNFRSL